ncbi:MAG: hypothetical protein KY456_00655 [Chloroflexi bacterium]|nr:hypothetical protein [Chloroflexota bacterium]
MVSDHEADGEAEGQGEAQQDAAAPDTVGTGSALAVGCTAAVVLLVLLALVVRWIAGGW